jgi:hypothetical protein
VTLGKILEAEIAAYSKLPTMRLTGSNVMGKTHTAWEAAVETVFFLVLADVLMQTTSYPPLRL